MNSQNMNQEANHAELAARLDQHPDYRVIRRFNPETLFQDAGLFPADAGIAVVLDTETTGRNAEDRIIELGMVSFAYDRTTGHVYGAIDRFNELEDPQMPIDPAASRVNNITDEMVAGKRIVDSAVQAFLGKADFIVAHNAGFDRPKCEARFKFMENFSWACSQYQVDWASIGITSAKLEFIAYCQGFFYDGHRADADCLALLNTLGREMGVLDGRNALSCILDQYAEASHRVWAISAPFDAKDLLKQSGCRWNDGTAPGSEKAWYLDVPASDLAGYLSWLKEEIYGNRSCAVLVDTVDAKTRFSGRFGTRVRTIL